MSTLPIGQITFAPSDPDRPGQCRPAIPAGGYVLQTPTAPYPQPHCWRVTTEEPIGFFDLPAPGVPMCYSSDHYPPGHIVIPPGKGYRHRCPGCGQVTVLIQAQVTL